MPQDIATRRAPNRILCVDGGFDMRETLHAVLASIDRSAVRPCATGAQVIVAAPSFRSAIVQLGNLGPMDVVTKFFDPLTVSDQINSIWIRHAAA